MTVSWSLARMTPRLGYGTKMELVSMCWKVTRPGLVAWRSALTVRSSVALEEEEEAPSRKGRRRRRQQPQQQQQQQRPEADSGATGRVDNDGSADVRCAVCTGC